VFSHRVVLSEMSKTVMGERAISDRISAIGVAFSNPHPRVIRLKKLQLTQKTILTNNHKHGRRTLYLAQSRLPQEKVRCVFSDRPYFHRLTQSKVFSVQPARLANASSSCSHSTLTLNCTLSARPSVLRARSTRMQSGGSRQYHSQSALGSW
jgi:hypothetical protein